MSSINNRKGGAQNIPCDDTLVIWYLMRRSSVTNHHSTCPPVSKDWVVPDPQKQPYSMPVWPQVLDAMDGGRGRQGRRENDESDLGMFTFHYGATNYVSNFASCCQLHRNQQETWK